MTGSKTKNYIHSSDKPTMPLRKAKQPVNRIVHLPLSTMPRLEPSNFIDTQKKKKSNQFKPKKLFLKKKVFGFREHIY